jgi:hypothetical protein
MEMKLEYIKEFSKELNKLAFPLKTIGSGLLNAAFGGMSINSASTAAKNSGRNLSKTIPLPLGPSQSFLKPDMFAKPIGRTSL